MGVFWPGLSLGSSPNLWQEWPFFKSMLDLIDVELGKANPLITQHYESKTLQERTVDRWQTCNLCLEYEYSFHTAKESMHCLKSKHVQIHSSRQE